MKFWIPTSIFLVTVIISLLMIPTCTRQSGNSRALFQEESLRNNVLNEQRHYDLIDKRKYLDLLNTLNVTTEHFFDIKTVDKDSLLFKSSNPKNKIYKKKFENIFFNKKTMDKFKTYDNLPTKLVDEPPIFGFIAEVIWKDSVEYLKLPFDALVGPFKAKEEIQ